MSIFEMEKALARETGRCMACDKPTRHFTSKGRDSYALLCHDPECKRYYVMLWSQMRARSKRG